MTMIEALLFETVYAPDLSQSSDYLKVLSIFLGETRTPIPYMKNDTESQSLMVLVSFPIRVRLC